MASINTQLVINDLNGRPISYQASKDSPPENLTVKMATIASLLEATQPTDLTEEQKIERWNLAKRISENDMVELVSKDIVLIRTCANKIFPTAIFVPFVNILEG